MAHHAHQHAPVSPSPAAAHQPAAAPAQHRAADHQSAADLFSVPAYESPAGAHVPRTMPHSISDYERQLLKSPDTPRSESIDKRFDLAHAVAATNMEDESASDIEVPVPQPAYHVRFKGDTRNPIERVADASNQSTDGSELSLDDSVTELRAGIVQKPFKVSTRRLMEASPYFAKMTDPDFDKNDLPGMPFVNPNEEDMPDEPDDEHHDRRALFAPIPEQTEFSPAGPFYFVDIDEFSFELFAEYVQHGHLPGPTDFHSMNHYLTLYIIAQRFQMEMLENLAMDCIRGYYRRRDMTAPAFRLDYVYRNTSGPCFLRRFLVDTAAFRALTEEKPMSREAISTSIQNVLRKGHDFAADYAAALVSLARNGTPDARMGDDCKWHTHHTTPICS